MEEIIEKAKQFRQRVDLRFFTDRESPMDFHWVSLGWASQFVRCFREEFLAPSRMDLRVELSSYLAGTLFEAFREIYPRIHARLDAGATISLRDENDDLLYEIPVHYLTERILHEPWEVGPARTNYYRLQGLFLTLVTGEAPGLNGRWAKEDSDRRSERRKRVGQFLWREIEKKKGAGTSSTGMDEFSSLFFDPSLKELDSLLADESAEFLTREPINLFQPFGAAYFCSLEQRPVSVRARLLSQAFVDEKFVGLLRGLRGIRGESPWFVRIDSGDEDGALWSLGTEREFSFYPQLVLPSRAVIGSEFRPFMTALGDGRLNEARRFIEQWSDRSSNPWYQLQRAKLLLTTGKELEAKPILDQVSAHIGGAPAEAQALYLEMLAELHFRARNWEEAGRLAELALKTAEVEDRARSATIVISALAALEKHSAALQVALKLTKRFSSSRDFTLRAILVALMAGDRELAWKWLQQIETILPTDEAVLRTRMLLQEMVVAKVLSLIQGTDGVTAP